MNIAGLFHKNEVTVGTEEEQEQREEQEEEIYLHHSMLKNQSSLAN